MGKFDHGVNSYTFAEATIQVAFPEDEVKCKWCPCLKHYDSMNRDKCGLTEKILYSTEITGHGCPLTVINQVETEELDR